MNQNRIQVLPSNSAPVNAQINPVTMQQNYAAMQAAAPTPRATQFTNTASATATYTNGSSGPVTTPATASNDVVILALNPVLTKTADKAVANPGDTVTYTISLQNTSAYEFTAVTIADTLPSGLTLVPGSITPTPGGGENLATGVTVPNIAASGTGTLTYQATVDAGATGTLNNSATATYTYDPGTGNTTETTAAVVNPLAIGTPSITLTKTADKNTISQNNNQVTYTITATNNGPVDFTDVTITDPIPAGMTYNANSTIIDSGSPTDQNPSSGVSIGALTVGQSKTLKFTTTATV